MTDEVVKYKEQIDKLEKENKFLNENQKKFNLLNDMFSEMLKMQDLEIIYKYVATSLQKHFANTIVLYVSINEQFNETRLETVEGIENIIMNKILSISGFNPVGKKYKLLPKYNDYFRSGKLVEFSGGLAEFSASEFPNFIARTIETLIGLNKIYTIGILKDENLLAAIHLLTFSKTVIEDNFFIETFVKQAGIIIQKKTAEIALLESETKSNAILQALPDMMFIQDREGVYLDYYLPENAITFVPPKVFFGQKIQNVLPDDCVGKFLPIFEKAISSKQIQTLNYSLPLPDKIHFYEARIISYEANRVLSIVRDMTDQYLNIQTIKKQNLELKRLNLDKDRFMQILAHDLQSPFNTLLGFSKLLLKNLHEYDIDKIENQLKIIHQTTQKTYTLLGDLLFWSKAQSGKLIVEPQKIVFAEICNEIIHTLKNQAGTKEISINCFEPGKTVIKADLNMFKTVLRNLISNAIKFTNKNGQINIYAEKNHKNVTITVSDSGVGIEKDNLPKLWDFTKPFSTSGTADEKGTGFGLLLCKEFVEKHGGEIWAESELGKGSDFKFTMPLSND